MNRSGDHVTVISVTYESAALVETLAQTLDHFQHVIVVDNASRDGTAQAMSARLPHAQVIRNSENIGFGAGNNRAMALVGTPYALLLNPDCDISSEALARLLDTAETYPSAAIIAPQAWRGDDYPQPSYRQAFYEKRPAQRYRIPDGTCSAKWLHGCCLLIKVEAFRRLGGFDERFFLFYEDDDLCLRTLQVGYDCLLEPRAQVLHAGGASSTPFWRTAFHKHYIFFQSRHLIISKYVGQAAAKRYRIKIALAAPFAAIIYAILLQRKHALKWLAWGCSAWRGVSEVQPISDRENHG